MNILLAILSAIVGIVCLVNFKPLSRILAHFFTQRFRESYGKYATERGWDDPQSIRNTYFYGAAAVFIGIFFLMIAFHLYFGTIYLNQ